MRHRPKRLSCEFRSIQCIFRIDSSPEKVNETDPLAIVILSSDAFWPTSDALWPSYIKFLTTPDSGYFLQSAESLYTKTQHISLSLKKFH